MFMLVVFYFGKSRYKTVSSEKNVIVDVSKCIIVIKSWK